VGHRDTTLEQAGQALLAHGVPGAIIAVAHGTTERGTEHSAVTGWAQRHVDPPVTMTAAARTDAGSITKIVATTAAAMRLVDAGEIVLDAPAERYLGPLAAGPVSVRELLEHRAGLWEWWPLYLDSPAPDAALARAAQLPPRYRRGTGRHYSDLGFVLLGAVVARVAATALETAVADLVLRPFGLTETRYAHPVDGDVVIASSAGDAIERAMIETGEPYPVQGSVTAVTGGRA
jgi:CubicO group peptidase (beta-lactamase class C family)